MNPIIIDGKEIAAEIIENLKQEPAPEGFVAVFMRRLDAAANSFVKQKEKTAHELGIELRRYEVQENDTNDSLRDRVRKVANTKRCLGVVLQLPLPDVCDPRYIANTIPSHKDLDCLGARCAGAVYHGKSVILPPAVRVVQHVLTAQKKSITDFQSMAVVGQGILVGKPIGVFYSGQVAHLTLFDKGFDKNELKKFNLIILGTGSVGLVRGSDIKKDAWVIDFGYDMRDKTLSGDFDVKSDPIGHVGLYTPTPGGTGPILVASLFENLFRR